MDIIQSIFSTVYNVPELIRLVGFIGIVVMLWPYLDVGHFTAGASAAIGALCAVASTFTNAGSVIQTRRLTTTETTSSIVFYFSIAATVACGSTMPFFWIRRLNPRRTASRSPPLPASNWTRRFV
mgnify:CR=1 FL=1